MSTSEKSEIDKNRYFIFANVIFFEESLFFPSTIPESPSISEAFPVPYLRPNDYVSSAPLPDLSANTVDVPDDSPFVPTPSRALDLLHHLFYKEAYVSFSDGVPLEGKLIDDFDIEAAKTEVTNYKDLEVLEAEKLPAALQAEIVVGVEPIYWTFVVPKTLVSLGHFGVLSEV
ncbi:hypothetical protein O6P43_020964 [Quillaja saponaria]|uniref:Uncharacterized protein n=1 Tax=Quillaja saponaria TaxID=32244 RepID=A0AAD7PME1_QUISA|nr:hypothetical protein O6P43_020964 [Quillaja saponaria]